MAAKKKTPTKPKKTAPKKKKKATRATPAKTPVRAKPATAGRKA